MVVRKDSSKRTPMRTYAARCEVLCRPANTSNIASARLSEAYTTATPGLFHRPPTLRAPSP